MTWCVAHWTRTIEAGVAYPHALIVRRPLSVAVFLGLLVLGALAWRYFRADHRLSPAEIRATLASASERPLPPVGSVPFRPGETAVYDVAWIAGAANAGLAAGVATFHVGDPADARHERGAAPGAETTLASAYAFTLSFETARWVSVFFEARDRFETSADRRLFPIVQVQHLREGARQVDRVTRYDHEALLVDVDGEVTLPMARGSRDALSAFYYARAIRTEPGMRIRIPVTEDGRDLRATVTDTGRDVIQFGGGRTRATRLDVQVLPADGQGSPASGVVWLSDDGRSIPLLMDITTAFGTFRAELTGYAAR
jgi:hypothetical protein